MRRTTVICFIFAGFRVLAQSPPSQPRFEVAAIKPSDPQSSDSSRNTNDGRFQATNQTLKALIAFAYDIQTNRVVGGPSWTASDKFDIIAKTPDDLGRRVRAGDYQPMTQALLADRFRLGIHRENRELPFYALVIAKGGAKL